MKFHLEISHRASAKTYRLVTDILENQKKNPDFVAGIIAPASRQLTFILVSLKARGGDDSKVVKINNYDDFRLNSNKISKLYVDDFEFISWLTPENVEELTKIDSFFASVPETIRDLDDFLPERDVLAKLICLNDGYILNRISFNSIHFYRPILQQSKEICKEGQFEKEYLCQFLK